MSEPSETHNRLAPQIFRQIMRETASGTDALIVVESVLLGILRAQAGSHRQAVAMLETLTERVVERLTPDSIAPIPFDTLRKTS